MNDEEIEKAVLYYVIWHGEEGDLSEDDFAFPKHKQIIKAIDELKKEKKEISILTIRNKINKDSTEILVYLSDLGNYISLSSFEQVYKILKKYTKKRSLLKLAKQMQAEIVNLDDDVNNYAEKIISNIQKIEYKDSKDDEFSIQISKAVAEIENKMKEKEDYSLYTGIFDLDALTDGLHNGELTVIGARPRSRKNNICITSGR